MQRSQELVGLESTSPSVVVEVVGVFELACDTHRPQDQMLSVSYSRLFFLRLRRSKTMSPPGIPMHY